MTGDGDQIKGTASQEDVTVVTYNRAVALLALGRYDEALEELKRITTRIPTHLKSQAALGQLSLLMGDNDTAAIALSKAIGGWKLLGAEHGDPLYNLGLALHRLGKNPEAVSKWRRTLEICPGHELATKALEAFDQGELPSVEPAKGGSGGSAEGGGVEGMGGFKRNFKINRTGQSGLVLADQGAGSGAGWNPEAAAILLRFGRTAPTGADTDKVADFTPAAPTAPPAAAAEGAAQGGTAEARTNEAPSTGGERGSGGSGLRSSRRQSWKSPEAVIVPLARLQGDNLPSGIDPACREQYLDDDEFQHIFGMDKVAFKALAKWRQKTLKQKAGLF